MISCVLNPNRVPPLQSFFWSQDNHDNLEHHNGTLPPAQIAQIYKYTDHKTLNLCSKLQAINYSLKYVRRKKKKLHFPTILDKMKRT